MAKDYSKEGNMKKCIMLACCLLFVFFGTANASLTVIGTATYNGFSYKLIHDSDGPFGPITWLDYTTSPSANWQTLMNWAASLNNPGVLSYNLNSGVQIDWDEEDWRLWSSNPYANVNTPTQSEMGDLFINELGNSTGLTNKGYFSNLIANWYVSDTLSAHSYQSAILFRTDTGTLTAYGIDASYFRGMAVRPGALVPIPGAALLFASSLFGLIGIRRKIRK